MSFWPMVLFLVSHLYRVYNTVSYWIGYKRLYQINGKEITWLYHSTRYIGHLGIGSQICGYIGSYVQYNPELSTGICEYKDHKYVRYIVPPMPINQLVRYKPERLVSLPYHDINQITHHVNGQSHDITGAKCNFYDVDGSGCDLLAMIQFFYMIQWIDARWQEPTIHQSTVRVRYDTFDIDTLEHKQYTKEIEWVDRIGKK